MSLDSPALLSHREFDAAALAAAHPPRWAHTHKRAVYELTSARPFAGTIGYSRWKARTLPERLPVAPVPVEAEADVYDYRDPGPAVWHVNFADPQLFVAYGSALLAQDELQALEHPQLGSVREALLAEGLPALTEAQGQPTPVLVSAVERRCALDTAPGLGRNTGLYGQRFAAAPFAQVRAALTLLEPAPRTNLIAIAAPSGGRGRYRLEQLEHILVTAYSGFAAAADLSGPIDLRTGFWGCGAFGGNRVVMVVLQLLAARLTNVRRVRFYAVDQSGLSDFRDGLEVLERVSRGETSVRRVLERLEARGEAWGQSDGN